MKFDLKTLKKVKEDEQSAVFQHANGHHVTIAKKALSSKMRDQLSQIPLHKAEGGEINYKELEARKAEEDRPYGVELAQASPGPDRALAGAEIPVNPSQPPNLAPETPPPSQMPQQMGNLQNYQLSGPKAPNMNVPLTATNLGDYQGAIEGYKKAGQAEAQAIGQQGRDEATAAQQQQNGLALQRIKAEEHFTEYDNERKAHIQDIQNRSINPNHYHESMSVPGKVSTAIGLILGGLGSGLTGGPNVAMEFLNNQIQRDMDAQKMNLNKEENLLAANFHHFGNMEEAQKMTMVMLADNYAAQLRKASASAMDPMAKARADQAANYFDLQVALPMMRDMAIKKTLLGGNAGGSQGGAQGGQGAQGPQGTPGAPQVDPAIAVRYLAPDETSKQRAMTEIQQQQNINSANKAALEAFEQVAERQTVKGRIEHFTQAHKQMDALWYPMMDKMVKTNEGRVTPVTVDLMSSLKPELTDSDETIRLKKGRLLAIINQDRSTPSLDSMGVKVGKDYGVTKPNSRVLAGYQNSAQPRESAVAKK